MKTSETMRKQLSDLQVSAKAQEIHNRAIIIDAHCDILMPIADGKFRLGDDITLPDPKTWQPPLGLIESLGLDMRAFSAHTQYFGCMGQYSIPLFKRGGLTVQVCGIFLDTIHLQYALQRGLQMAWWLHKEAEDNPDFEVVTTAADIRRLKQEGKCGGILALEGLDALGFDLRFLDIYYRLGLRVACLTHNRRNFFADGPQPFIKTGGLTEAGRQAVTRMDELGIVVDLAHTNHHAYWEILELTKNPIIISHRSSRQYFGEHPEESPFYPGVDISRGRERLEALQKKGGVFGVIFFSNETIADVVADMEYVIDTIGPDHVGLGSDLFGIDTSPVGLTDMSKLPLLTEALVRRGHSEEVILKILGGNMLRVFETVWKG